MPNGTAWPVVAFGASRAGATLVPLSTFLRPPELGSAAPHRGRRASGAAGEFLGRDYVADLMAISPELVEANAPDGRGAAPPAHRHRVGGRRPCGGRGDATPSSSPPSTRRCDPPTTSRSCSPPAVAATPKGVIHTHGGALGRHRGRARGPPAHARRPPLHPDAVLLGRWLRHRPALDAHRRRDACSPRRRPEPARTLPFLERERVTLFRGWPDQAAALARDPRLRVGRPLVAAPGQPRRGAARGGARPGPGSGRACSA